MLSRDQKALSDGPNERGHRVWPLGFDLGAHPLDAYVDLDPSEAEGSDAHREQWARMTALHLKTATCGVLATSFRFAVENRG